MKPILYIAFIATTFTILSCGVPRNEHRDLQTKYDLTVKERDSLLISLDDCENGPQKLSAKIDVAIKNKDFPQAKKYLSILKEKHPQADKSKTSESLFAKIEKLDKIEKKRIEAEEKEKKRLANLNNTGMWEVTYYVDDFGEPTKEGYITNKKYIKGTFSNTATQNSDLNATFAINKSTDISLFLYEYAKNNPVKAYSPDEYRVLLQDKDGNRYRLKATNYSDRLVFNAVHSKKIHQALKLGGEVKFKIVEVETPTTNYSFTIKNADFYGNAFTKLFDKK